ncbi:hypothetical protein HF086_017739 [Spodoptera exigua]|uniref:TSP C-terminal domain-containing protein n=1 Tax=Spodoptera exigua TaxID=7107 RepID=A0A922SDC0_SPOEX|nr:hypothetical protein HF086_017739 [Spodoptera exigua]
MSMVQAWSAVTRPPESNVGRVRKAWRETDGGADPSAATDDPVHKWRDAWIRSKATDVRDVQDDRLAMDKPAVPPGYHGNGQQCQHVCDSHKPCGNRRCSPTSTSPYYNCEGCPKGFEWNGYGCVDIDECDLIRPCDEVVSCRNEEGGFTCGPCPPGYEGSSGWRGSGNERRREQCVDVDECADGRANCPRGRLCVNTPTGWAGNGTVCGPDKDLDGYPDHQLACLEPRCRADNCPEVSNSGQEDADGDGIGDSCDPDADGIPNEMDNCPRRYNPAQEDLDNDGVGDACDNCPRIRNRAQEDADRDGVDAEKKYWILWSISKLENICRDGIQDSIDNCLMVPNSDQLDVDEDGIGDACDDDDDGDGIPDVQDNCPYIKNPDQKDSNNDGVGDACDNDYDGDNVINELDNCPNNSKIFRTDFRNYMTVRLDPEGESQQDPNWEIANEGAEILQTLNSDPGLAVGFESFSGVDFEGTFFVDTQIDDDYVGFIFGYQNNKRFYVVMWKKNTQTYWQTTPFRAVAEPGIQLKLVNSKTGPGKTLRNALWNTETTADQVTLLWKDPRNVGWREKTAYRWRLLHRPKLGLIRLKVYENNRLVADSGNVYDFTLKGGRLGVFYKIPSNIASELSSRNNFEVDHDFVYV